MVDRDSDTIKISIRGKLETYKVIKVYEFNSDRKMMSVTVKRESDGVIINFGKGADMAITKRLKNIDEDDQKLTDRLNEYATTGLRTLMFSFRNLQQSDLEGEGPNDENENVIEQDYELIGVTGVEDLLQDNVKDVITDFMKADIKVWMLTGDKGATARNIGKTCGIIED